MVFASEKESEEIYFLYGHLKYVMISPLSSARRGPQSTASGLRIPS
jgi:hypothetical protein